MIRLGEVVRFIVVVRDSVICAVPVEPPNPCQWFTPCRGGLSGVVGFCIFRVGVAVVGRGAVAVVVGGACCRALPGCSFVVRVVHFLVGGAGVSICRHFQMPLVDNFTTAFGEVLPPRRSRGGSAGRSWVAGSVVWKNHTFLFHTVVLTFSAADTDVMLVPALCRSPRHHESSWCNVALESAWPL